MSTAEVEVWLERISVVGRKSRTDGFLDVLQWYSELQNFLCAWKNKFSTEENGGETLAAVPQMKKLISKLCQLPALLVIPDVCKLIVDCIVCLLPSKASEHDKKDNWASKALKRIVLKAEKDLSSGVSEKAGFTQDTVIGCCLSEISRSVSLLEPLSAEPEGRLGELAKICAHLAHVPQFSELLLRVLLTAPKECLAQDVLVEISNTLYEKGERCDSTELLACLWLKSLPALEAFTLRVLVENISGIRCMGHCDRSSRLVRNCTKHACIYHAVSTMLYKLWSDWNKNARLSQFVGQLHSEYLWSKHQKTVPFQPSCQWDDGREIESVLDVHPASLVSESLEHSIQHLNKHKSSLVKIPEVEFTLCQHNVWQHAAWMCAFLGRTQMLESSCGVVLMFHDAGDHHGALEALKLSDIVRKLRGMMAAPLSSADVEVALALCAVTEDARAAGVMRQLLLVFAVHARVGVSSFRALLQRIPSRNEDELVELNDVLSVMEACLPFWSGVFRDAVRENVGPATRLVRDLAHRAEDSHGSSDKTIHSERRRCILERTSNLVQQLELL